uniref:Uncharacterized protein n=1 Tax=Steinernema glaseri TaxID=37863 RepID=A0A1I7Z0H3_9BILA
MSGNLFGLSSRRYAIVVFHGRTIMPMDDYIKIRYSIVPEHSCLPSPGPGNNRELQELQFDALKACF